MNDQLDRLKAALAGRYEIEREVGQGGMANVYLAHDLRHDREVAVKVLRPDLAAALGTERFLREIKIAANLTHPHILPLYDSGEAEGFLYYVMPYIEGETLRQRIEKEGELPVTETVRIVREVVDALAFAHSHGVVHRDIKPDNVMLSGRHAMVADFGVAKAVSEATGRQALTTAGVALGTPAYMAPEQAAADPHVDHRADIYAVGAVAYELLTGRTPFTGATPQAMLAAHVTEQVEPVSKHRDHVSAELEAVVMRCLEKKPADRWQSADELLAALEPLSTPSGGMTPTATRPVERTTSPDRRRATTAIGAVLAVAAIAAVFLWPRGWSYDGDPRESLIVFPFENRTGDDDRDWLEEASLNLLALSLSHWDDLRVFDDERTASLMRRRDIASARDIDFDAAQAMAQEANVGTLVMGDIRREGNEIVIEAKVHDVESGDRLMTEIVRAAFDADPRPLLDSLADRILLISGAPPGQNPGVLVQTTTSVEAYRSYLRGSLFMQRIALDSARHYFERAVALDTTFALAYIGLRNVEGWLGTGDDEKRRSFVARAEAHSTNLPPRWRSLIQYYTAYESGNFPRARNIAEGMIARDSSDTEAWYQLGEAQFHHSARRFPHPDTLGDMGKALFAFERTLALDSGYVLAYFHIVDALGYCSSTRERFVCLTDSTVYGEPDDLEERFGADELARLRQEAADRQVEVGYAWVAEVPETSRPRVRLTNLLLQQKRYAEAERQAVRLREIGDTLQADFFRLTALFAQRRFAAAADVAAPLLTDMPDELAPASIGGYNQALQAMATAGRIAPADRFFNALPIEERVFNSPVTGERVRIPMSVMVDGLRTMREEGIQRLTGGTYADRDEARRIERWWDAFLATAFTDSVMARIVRTVSCGHSYPFARDTTTLVEWIALLPDSVCPGMRGHLALARGDTAAARTLGNGVSSQLPQDPKSWNAENAVMAYSWADLLASMGQAREALDAYAKLDSVNFTWQASRLVRSWAERAAIHQALGETQDAIRLYQEVLDVLRNADEPTQPFVRRIEAALAAASGVNQRN